MQTVIYQIDKDSTNETASNPESLTQSGAPKNGNQIQIQHNLQICVLSFSHFSHFKMQKTTRADINIDMNNKMVSDYIQKKMKQI